MKWLESFTSRSALQLILATVHTWYIFVIITNARWRKIQSNHDVLQYVLHHIWLETTVPSILPTVHNPMVQSLLPSAASLQSLCSEHVTNFIFLSLLSSSSMSNVIFGYHKESFGWRQTQGRKLLNFVEKLKAFSPSECHLLSPVRTLQLIPH